MLSLVLAIGTMATMAALLTVRGWRPALGALIVQYGLVGGLVGLATTAELALVHVGVGGLATAMLYLSLRTAEPSGPFEATAAAAGDRHFLTALLVAAALAVGLATTYPLPNAPEGISLAAYWLSAAGLLWLVVGRAAWRAAFVLLALHTAGLLFGVALADEPLPLASALWAVLTLLVAFAASYLVMLERKAPA